MRSRQSPHSNFPANEASTSTVPRRFRPPWPWHTPSRTSMDTLPASTRNSAATLSPSRTTRASVQASFCLGRAAGNLLQHKHPALTHPERRLLSEVQHLGRASPRHDRAELARQIDIAHHTVEIQPLVLPETMTGK